MIIGQFFFESLFMICLMQFIIFVLPPLFVILAFNQISNPSCCFYFLKLSISCVSVQSLVKKFSPVIIQH